MLVPIRQLSIAGLRVCYLSRRELRGSDGTELWFGKTAMNFSEARIASDPLGRTVMGSNAAGGDGVALYDSEHNFVWHGASAWVPSNVAFDSNGDCLVSGQGLGVGGLTKLDGATGAFLWSYNHGGRLYDVAVDSLDNIYVVGELVGGINVLKFTSAGVPVWSFGINASLRAVEVHGNGLYIGSAGEINPIPPPASWTLHVYDLDGVFQWHDFAGSPVDTRGFIYEMKLDSAGDIYYHTLPPFPNRNYLVKRAPIAGGAILWFKQYDAPAYLAGGISIDSSDNVFFSTETSGVDSLTTWKYDSAGNELWTHSHGPALGDRIDRLAALPSGNVAIVGTQITENVSARTWDTNRIPIWKSDHGANLYALAVDPTGNRYVGGVVTGGISTRKYDPSGVLQWSVSHGASVYGIAVAPDGSVYTGGSNTPPDGMTTRKYDSDGNLLWSANHGDYVYGVAAAPEGVVTGGAWWGPNLTTRRYDSAGNLLWSVDHGGDVLCVAIDQFGYIYTGGSDGSPDGMTTRCYDSMGNLQWSVTHGGTVRGIAIGPEGNVYTGGLRIGGITTRAYSSTGVLLWTADHGDTVHCVAVDPEGLVYTGGQKSTATPLITWTPEHNVRVYQADGTYLFGLYHGSTTVFGIDVDPGRLWWYVPPVPVDSTIPTKYQSLHLPIGVFAPRVGA